MDTHLPHPTLSRAALVRIVSTVSAGFVITQLDVTIVNVALARIGIDLHTSVAGLQWIVDAYTLALAGLMLSAGALGDRFGARRLFAAGLALFAVASFVYGIAANAATLIAARALQGLAAAAMLPNSLALLNHACAHDPRLRARAVGWWTASGAISIAAGAAFVFVESRSAHPMMPLALFRRRTFSVAVLFGVCMNLSYYGIIFVLSLYLQRVRHDTPLEAGLAFLPLTGGFLLSNVASGWATAHYGPRRPMIAGALIGATGFALLSAVRADTPIAMLVVPFLLIPGGMGLAVPAMTTTVLASVERARAATASAVLNTARQAGGAIGVAAFGALASGARPPDIVSGLHASAYVSAALFVFASAMAAFVHGAPQPAAGKPANANAR